MVRSPPLTRRAVVINILVAAYVIGNVTEMAMRLADRTRDFRERYRVTEEFVACNRLPHELAEELRSFQLLAHSAAKEHPEALDFFPPVLQCKAREGGSGGSLAPPAAPDPNLHPTPPLPKGVPPAEPARAGRRAPAGRLQRGVRGRARVRFALRTKHPNIQSSNQFD